jgi:hypothetical protein
MRLNTGVLALYAGSWLGGRAGRHRVGQLLTVPALGLAVGVLLRRPRVGMWVETVDADDVQTGQLSVVQVLDAPVLARTAGQAGRQR